MPPSEQISRKIEKIRGYLAELANFRTISATQLMSDTRSRAALERFLYLLCDSIISLAEMQIAARGYERAESYGENADILLAHGEISATEAEFMHKIIGLRNVLSHDYERLNLEILKTIVDEKLGDIDNLLVLFSKK